MTDTERYVAALERKAELAEADLAMTGHLATSTRLRERRIRAEARAEAFREAAAMARHPSARAHQ